MIATSFHFARRASNFALERLGGINTRARFLQAPASRCKTPAMVCSNTSNPSFLSWVLSTLFGVKGSRAVDARPAYPLSRYVIGRGFCSSRCNPAGVPSSPRQSPGPKKLLVSARPEVHDPCATSLRPIADAQRGMTTRGAHHLNFPPTINALGALFGVRTSSKAATADHGQEAQGEYFYAEACRA